METQLQTVDRQIQSENNRHKMAIDNINKQKERENTQHEQTMRMLNSRKEQIKRSIQNIKAESCDFKELNEKLKEFVEK